MNSLKDIDFKEGKNKTQTATYLKFHRRSVNEWTKRFFNGGLDALNEKPPTSGRLKGTLLIYFIKKTDS